jgi:DNA integrity scanning protein DisA with diadenylate cyclase activity
MGVSRGGRTRHLAHQFLEEIRKEEKEIYEILIPIVKIINRYFSFLNTEGRRVKMSLNYLNVDVLAFFC